MSPHEPIRIVIVDDHPMIRTGLAAMVRTEPGFEWVGEAASGSEAVALAAAVRADIVLMDLMMPGLDGIDATVQLLRQRPQAKVLLLTSVIDPFEVQRAIRAGAHAYVSKTASAQELVTIIRNVHAGRRVMSPEVTDALIRAEQSPRPGADLTEREREVLETMAAGLNNHAIAARLGVSVPTIKFHITNILAKLGVENRTEAVLLALKHRLVEPR